MIALDSSAIICLVERVGTTHDEIRRLLREHNDYAMASTLAITECMTQPLLQSDTVRIDRHDKLFQSPELRIDEADQTVARVAAELRARFFLTTPDAVHLATAINSRAAKYVSTDAKAYAACAGRVDVEVVIVPRTTDLPRTS